MYNSRMKRRLFPKRKPLFRFLLIRTPKIATENTHLEKDLYKITVHPSFIAERTAIPEELLYTPNNDSVKNSVFL